MTTWNAVPNKEGQRVISTFVRRLEATGCTDVTITPMKPFKLGDGSVKMGAGRYAISAIPPEWGMGNRGWKAWLKTETADYRDV